MNQSEKEAIRIMLPLVKHLIPKAMAASMGYGSVDKEDVWKMCTAIEIGKKYGFMKTER